MKYPVKVYVFTFFISYLYSNVIILGVFLCTKLYFYFFKYKMKVQLFNLMYEDIRFLLFMPIITGIALTMLYFARE